MTSPPRPPSPPSGPPFGTNFSLRKLTDPPPPLANATFVVANESNAVAEFTTDNQGHFKVSLLPGHYTVIKKERQKGIGRYGPFDVEVVAGQMTKVEWQCDTGMRSAT